MILSSAVRLFNIIKYETAHADSVGCLCIYRYQVLKIIIAIMPPPITTTPIISQSVIRELAAAFELVGAVAGVLVLL